VVQVKLRIRDNSIRLRLTRVEVDTVSSTGIVKARVSVPGGDGLDYVLECSAIAERPSASLSGGALTVTLPESELMQWAKSEQVSIEADEDLGHGDSLKILVEKDFACLAPREGEDEMDMYPHPLEGQD
jgi:Family of unknown function (DUF7009)